MSYTTLSEEEVLTKAFALLKARRLALVITVAGNGGGPTSRVMTPTVHEGNIWFRTRRKTGKVRQLSMRPGAQIVTAADGFAQVARFSGVATLISEDDLVNEPGAPESLAGLFEEELEDERLLMKFVPRKVHFVDHPGGCRGEATIR